MADSQVILHFFITHKVFVLITGRSLIERRPYMADVIVKFQSIVFLKQGISFYTLIEITKHQAFGFSHCLPAFTT